MLILVRKTHWYVEVLTSNFFSHENLSSGYMANVKDLFVELQILFGFPPSFNRWYSPLAWWRSQWLTFPVCISVFIQHRLSDAVDQLQQFSKSICQFQFSKPGIPNVCRSFLHFRFSVPIRNVIFYRYNQLLCRVQCRMCIAVRHPKPARM